MVEYRHDPASGRTVFMEINGRFWGSLPLPRDFPVLTACYWMPESKRLLQVLL